MESGVPYVMWGLISKMPMSYASNLDFQVQTVVYIQNSMDIYNHIIIWANSEGGKFYS